MVLEKDGVDQLDRSREKLLHKGQGRTEHDDKTKEG